MYVASPELNLLLQASELHVTKLCQMLGRYWGSFSTKHDEEGDLLERAPLTTEEKLLRFLGHIDRTPGLGVR